MISQPGLPPFALTTDHVAKDETLVRITLPLNKFGVDIGTSTAAASGGVCIRGFHPEIELWNLRKLREVQTGTDRCVPRSRKWTDIVVNQRIAVQREPLSHEGQTIGEVECPEACAG